MKEFLNYKYLSRNKAPVNSTAARIRAFNADRLPAFTALKYQLMAENPFRFFRGTCHLFYEDMGSALSTAPSAWSCGDLHLENFGSYKGDNRLVYFDLNDFDEGILAPATCDLTRMVTSIFCGFASLGIDKKEARRVATQYLKIYASNLARGRARYVEPRTAQGIVCSFLEKVSERRQKDLIRQRTIIKDDKLRLKIDKIRLFPLEKQLKKSLIRHIQTWLSREPHCFKNYKVLDAAFRVAGTGSLGQKRYVFLVRNGKDTKKYLLIDMKQSLPSSLLPYTSITQPAWTSESARIIAIQERMQNIPPALLSSIRFQNDDYVVKEMQPIADKIDFVLMKDRYKDIECVIGDMALLTASAQLRSAARQNAAGPDDLIAFGKEDHWHKEMLDYAIAYADKVDRDYQEFFTAWKAGYFEHPQ